MAEREEGGVHHRGCRWTDEATEQALVLDVHLVAEPRHRFEVRRVPVVQRLTVHETLPGDPIDVEVDRQRVSRRDRRAPEGGDQQPDGKERRATEQEEASDLTPVRPGRVHVHTW